MPHLTMEDFERARKRAESGPPLSPDEQKRLEEFAKKMQNLSKEELLELICCDDDDVF